MPNTPPSPLSPAPHIRGEPVSGGLQPALLGKEDGETVTVAPDLQLTEEPEVGPPETIPGGARASTESLPPPHPPTPAVGNRGQMVLNLLDLHIY